MTLDPSTLTPAAVKSRMLQDQSAPQMSFPQATQPTMSMPRIDAVNQKSLIPGSELDTNSSDDAFAQQIGVDIFGSTLENTSPEAIASMATDNADDVDDSVKNIYSGQTDFAQILGALTSMGLQETATEKLLKEVSDEKATPEEARKKVNEFFKIDTDKETPMWADVALSVGLSLLRGEGGKGEFLSDIGVAGERGLKVARTRRKEKKAEDLMLDKLAFGVFREDEKSRKTLISQLTKQLGEERKESKTYALNLAKFFQKNEEINETQAKNRAGAITNTLNTFSTDLKAKALPIIAKSPDAFKGVPTDEIPSVIYGLLKNGGLNLDEISDSKNIVESNFMITDADTYTRFQTAFPSSFPEPFQEGKEYRVQGFSDKSRGKSQMPMTSVLSVEKSLGGQDELSRLITTRNDLNAALIASPEDENIKQQLTEVNGRIDILSTRKSPMSYIFVDGKMVAAGEGAAGAYAQAEAISKGTELSKQGNSLAAAYGLGDNILRSLASTPSPADSVGVVANFGKFIGGGRGQIDAVINTFGNNASDNQANYLNGTITSSMQNSSQRVGNTTVGSVFKRLEAITQGNTEIKSQLMSFAYALAGSRETGKLTDKDVAAALVTFGGGDIADGKWFANPNVLVTGINQALDTATNAFAVKYDSAHNTPDNIKYLRDVEGLSETEIARRTKFNLPDFIKKNEGIREGLGDRVSIVNGRVQFQGLDKYRGDGAGNVDPGSSRFTQQQITDFNTIDRLYELYKDDTDQLTKLIQRFDAETLEAYRRFKKGDK
jgi:hypothetical protein|tara:strand:+ start:3081 stop:5411 length:2331 start_codon:yes stop_codon:yes gene_type:complete